MSHTPDPTNSSESYHAYLERAAHACEAGDFVLGMHLYLAAYEKAITDPNIPKKVALAGLKEAWNLACDLKERSMAEYVFEKLEPYLSGDEIANCAHKLQDLALDRLEEYGFSRDELQDMAEMITQDFSEGDSSLIKVESIAIPQAETLKTKATPYVPVDEIAKKIKQAQEKGKQEAAEGVAGDAADGASDSASKDASKNADAADQTTQAKGAHSSHENRASAQTDSPSQNKTERISPKHEKKPAAKDKHADDKQPSIQKTNIEKEDQKSDQNESTLPSPGLSTAQETKASTLNYETLTGYTDTLATMRELGIGLSHKPEFVNFVKMMNARHGIAGTPTIDSMLFRSPAIEDATRFAEATALELNLPVLRMSMEENFQGAPVLCIAVNGDNRPRMNHTQNRFEGPGVLLIDELDMWITPQMPEGVEGFASIFMASMSRGAYEAMNLIRSAVENPDVYVIATAHASSEIDPFFLDILEQVSIIDIALPNEADRRAIWAEIIEEHPSMKGLNIDELVKHSCGLPRCVLYMAARTAIEEAYKEGLSKHAFVPVTDLNLLDKLAAMLPVESKEYQAIENKIVDKFSDELDDMGDFLD